ncbi:protein of unknown function [Candidatus Nitrospira inopinata]|uniref:Uncharacterized protein n=1 Tax=Candidatus Nitrospira inopinata TaxID=1715989 RepID=A0A0S4L056_9BACT|nr:protein of unknown function [Candidatus Nitrospira inopinata]
MDFRGLGRRRDRPSSLSVLRGRDSRGRMVPGIERTGRAESSVIETEAQIRVLTLNRLSDCNIRARDAAPPCHAVVSLFSHNVIDAEPCPARATGLFVERRTVVSPKFRESRV